MSDVRLARDEEYDAVGELTLLAYSSGGVLAADDSYAQVLADARGRAVLALLYVLTDDTGVIVGTVNLSPHGTAYAQVGRPGELEFRMLAVDPAHGGRGYGSRLIDFCAEAARARGFDRLVICVIETNHAALRLYDRLGFVRRPDRDKDAGPAVHLLTLTYALRRRGPWARRSGRGWHALHEASAVDDDAGHGRHREQPPSTVDGRGGEASQPSVRQ